MTRKAYLVFPQYLDELSLLDVLQLGLGWAKIEGAFVVHNSKGETE